MKKLIIAFIVFAAFSTGKTSAQGSLATLHTTTRYVVLPSLNEGQNSVLLKDGQGTLQFTKTGDRFSDVVFKDAAGKSTRLVPVHAGTQGAPKPECKYALPDACFGTADKNIGLCICKPSDISTEYSINYYVKKHISNVKYND